MRKPDPARFSGKTTPKVDSLDMKGFSAAPLNLHSPSGKELQKIPTRLPERSSGRTDEWADEHKKSRIKTRHAFDIFQDQLRSLQKIQLEAVQANERKPNLGEMVQEALDAYLQIRENDRAIGQTSERENVRTDE